MYVFRVTVRRFVGKGAKLRVEEFYARAHTWFLLREAVRAAFPTAFGTAASVEFALVEESEANAIRVAVDDKGEARWT